jgi:hypothetical protein
MIAGTFHEPLQVYIEVNSGLLQRTKAAQNRRFAREHKRNWTVKIYLSFLVGDNNQKSVSGNSYEDRSRRDKANAASAFLPPMPSFL